jgi:hypothetical protein
MMQKIMAGLALLTYYTFMAYVIGFGAIFLWHFIT